MENTYKKRFTNAEHTEYEIVEVYPDDSEVVVSEEQDLYQQWLSEGSTPEEVAYVEPDPEPEPEIPEPPVDETPHDVVPTDPKERRSYEYNRRIFTEDAYAEDYPTVDMLAWAWNQYMAEGDVATASPMQPVIAARKATIRSEFPDA